MLPGSKDDPWIAEAFLAGVQRQNSKPDGVSSPSWAEVTASQLKQLSLQSSPSTSLSQVYLDSMEQCLKQVSNWVAVFGERLDQFGGRIETVSNLVDRWLESAEMVRPESPLDDEDDKIVQVMQVEIKQEPESPHYTPTSSMQGMVMEADVKQEPESPHYTPTSSMRYSPSSPLSTVSSVDVTKAHGKGFISVTRMPPRGLAILQEVTGSYGVCTTMQGEVLVFNKSTFLDGGSLHVTELNSVFRAGDWVNVTGSSRFHPQEHPDVLFTVHRMEWFKGTNDDLRTHVAHAVFLSREPQPVFGIPNHRHVDAHPSALIATTP